MQSSNIPAKFSLEWAQNAGAGFVRDIPSASQPGGAASLNDGFPAVTMQSIASGGIPPWGEDANGILRQLSRWARWQGAGGPVTFDSAYATAIGGYPAGAVLQAAGLGGGFWRNTTDNNSTNPDTGGAGWVNFFAPVFASPTFTGTLTSQGAAVFNSTLTANGGVSTPNSSGVDSSGNFTVNNIKNNNVSFINPSNAMASFENPFGTVSQMYYAGSAPNIATLQVGQNTTTGQMVLFNYRGTPIGGVSNTTTSVSYLTTSDYRLKTNFTVKISGADALARINAIDIYRGKMKGEEDGPEFSYVLAHQFQEHLPHAVSGVKDDEIDLGEVYVPAGTPVAYGVDQPAQELPAGHAWVPTGWRAGEPVPNRLGKMRAGPRVATGDVILAVDMVTKTNHPEPDAANLEKGCAWRKTHRQINPQMVDHSKAVPDLIAAVQELTRLVKSPKKGQGDSP